MVIQKIRSRRHYSENKSKARKELIKERKLFFAQSIEASNNIAGNLIKYFIYNNYSIINKKISIYWPIGSEVNTKPCIAALYDFGAKICLASTEDNDVKYRLWKPNDKIEINK